jgi:hypothetical protein
VVKIGNAVTYLFLILSLHWPALAQDVQVLATVDQNEVSVGQSFNFKITISSDSSVSSENPRLGNIQGLQLINSWTSQQTQSIFSNGSFQVINAREYNYMFAANQTGQITIPAAEVIVEGKSYTTSPITIQVSAGGGGSRNQGRLPPEPDQMDQFDQMDQMFNQLLQRRFGTPQPGGRGGTVLDDDTPINPKEAFFIRAEADKKTAYVGEQVTANWYLYTRGQITDIDTLKYPTLKGFWKEEIEMATRLDFEQVVINGIPYQRALLVSYALFPIKAGKAHVDSYRAKCTVLTPGNFGFGRPYQFTKASKPLDLNVIDVPKDTRPNDFTGAVGSFRIKAELDRNEVPAHQPVTWKIRVEGRGNAKLIDLPALNLSSNLELYDQKVESQFQKNGTSFKEFEILLIPREEGEIEIPSIKISVFNPEKKAFERIETQSLKLKVTPGSRTDQNTMAGSSSPNQPAAEPQKTSAQLPFFASPDVESEAGLSLPVGTWWGAFGVSLVSVFAHAFLALGRTRRKETLSQALKQRLKRLNRIDLKAEPRKFGAEISNSTYKILSLVVGSASGSKELDRILKEGPPSLRKDLGESLKALLSEAEAVAFAPEEIAKKSFDEKNLTKLKNDFEKLMKASIQKVEED